MVELMIEKMTGNPISDTETLGYPDWNDGLYYACEGGHMDIVELMIERGATNWNDGLHNACCGGHIDIAKLMIEKGATECYCMGDNCLYQRLKN